MVSLLIVFYAISACCEVISGITISSLFRECYTFEDTSMLYTIGAFHKLLLILSIFFLLRFRKSKLHIKEWLRYMPIPISILIAMLWFYATSYENNEVFGQMLALGIFGFLTCIFMIGYVQYKCELKRTTDRLKLMEEHEWHRRHYLEDKQALQRNQARLEHDSHHHIEYMASLTNIEDVHEYAARILDLNKFSMQITGNTDIDSILWPKQQRAQEKGISFNVSGLLPQRIDWLNPIDIVTIIGNGLANAIDACEKINGTNLFINATFRLDKHLDIRIDNPFIEAPEIKKSGSLFKSTKKEPGHGIGMESIQSAVNRYHGHMETVIKNGVFSLRIMLQHITSPDEQLFANVRSGKE
jgi:Tfp pilus assembly protein PilE